MRWIATIMLCLLVMSCTEVIDLRVDDRDPLVTINAVFNNGTLGNNVELTRTSAYDRIVPRPISSAQVRVYKLDGEYISFKEDRENPGVYLIYEQPFLGEEGEEYQLEVVLPTREVYQSAWQKLPYKTAVDHLDFEIGQVIKTTETGQVFEFLGATIYKETEFLSPDEEVYLRWKVEEVYTILEAYLPPQNFITRQFQCFVWNDLSEQEIFLLNGLKIRNFELNNRELVTRRVDRSFSNKHYFNLIQMALTKESHDYWEKVNSVTTLTGSIFDTPPGAIPGNVKSTDPNEVVLGFFDVVQIDTARTFLTNDDILYFFDDPCYVTGAARYYQLISVPFDCRQCLVDRGVMPQECVDCIKVNNSSFERPSYF